MKKHYALSQSLFLALILLLSVPAAAKTVRKGWRTENGTTYYYKNGRAVKALEPSGKRPIFLTKRDVWQKIAGYGARGRSIGPTPRDRSGKNGFITVSGKKYLLNADGSVAKGFKKRGENWYYFTKDGSMATGLTKIGKNTYYFNKKGIRQTGEKKIGNTTYYFQNDGKLEAKKTVKKGEDDLLRKRRQEADRQRSGEEEDPGEGGKNRSEDHQCLHEQGAEKCGPALTMW